jgi:hypothetical protein
LYQKVLPSGVPTGLNTSKHGSIRPDDSRRMRRVVQRNTPGFAD